MIMTAVRRCMILLAAGVICTVVVSNNYTYAEKAPDLCQPLDTNSVLALAEGKENSFVVTGDGTLWAVGKNDFGQLGTGTCEDTDQFQAVLNDVASISAGFEHTAAVKTNGQLYLWGNNSEGQLGTGGTQSAAPQLVLENTVQASAGGFHTLAVKEDGSLWIWGNNVSGVLGTGPSEIEDTPVKVMNDVKEAGAGWYFSAAVKYDSTLWTWGWNENGRLGTGSDKDSKQPVQIMDNVKTIAIGPSHSLALKEDGTLWAWGDNRYGQLGDGTVEHRYEPILVMEGVAAISAGYCSSAAVTEDGRLYTWGANKGLWLGFEGKKANSTPIFVKSDVYAISQGRAGSLAATKDGRLYLDSTSSNKAAFIVDGKPVLDNEILSVFVHNENVYYSKRTDEQALGYYLQPSEDIQSDDPQIIALAAEITAGAETDTEKLLAIHDWVCSNLYYNYDAYYSGAVSGDISSLGALSEKTAVCSGYTNLTAALLRASGIPSKYIKGYATSQSAGDLTTEEIARSVNTHAWNEAYVDGRWVIIDTTWDSNNRFENGRYVGLPFSRTYFDISLAQIAKTHMIREYTEFLI